MPTETAKSGPRAPSKLDARATETNRVARSIIEAEREDRDKQTQRLRKSRLEREASETPRAKAAAKKPATRVRNRIP
ncbi:hypothetical protein EF888_05695 [Silicimonas algicola]|uniref:Uncharacterized protein n=1 Tax=Silicimonas algicola TaxID=1826607 RepID=A0A316GI28_9RHOB|nr:hypothetical protein [Silicimonas algicola]AZQ66677.1 hypothetical protein EF888_05695 [Silicimonas algicola]PWK59030.1 hypothetical protein C8D95_101852 [Silicimonas algicola]